MALVATPTRYRSEPAVIRQSASSAGLVFLYDDGIHAVRGCTVPFTFCVIARDSIEGAEWAPSARM